MVRAIVYKSLYIVQMVLAVYLFTGCSEDAVDELNEAQSRSMKMNFRVNVKQFDINATRGGDELAWEWKDGDVIYLQYHVGEKLVRGHAVYSKETDSWEAFYNGTLASTEQCEVYFFEGASTSDKKQVTLTGSEAIYTDIYASYVVEDGEITLSAFLTPLTGRLQFTGAQGTKIQVSGIQYYTGYDAETNTLTTSTEALSRTVATDGYTPYIYGVFADTDKRELTVTNSIDGDHIDFVRSFGMSVFQVGKSGYMTIPTSDTNKGWTEIKRNPILTVNQTSLNFSFSVTSCNVSVTSNIIYTVSSSATWCTATLSSDRNTLRIAVTENTGNASRSAKVTLKHEITGLTATVNITQSAFGTFTVTGNGKTVTFKMIKVGAGTFQMGKDAGGDNETPVHQVTLTKDYFMGETEVTQALWYAVMGQSPTSDGSKWSSSSGLGDNYPAYYISYEDIESFLTKLNTLVSSQLPSGKQFRFPTEAEWEFAAKGGNKSKGYTYAGSNTIGNVAWYYHNSNDCTHPVKEKGANELGLYDMSGNVSEWCYDFFEDYSSSAQTDPTGPITGYTRIHRGGSRYYVASVCRSVERALASPSGRSDIRGFRLSM